MIFSIYFKSQCRLQTPMSFKLPVPQMALGFRMYDMQAPVCLSVARTAPKRTLHYTSQQGRFDGNCDLHRLHPKSKSLTMWKRVSVAALGENLAVHIGISAGKRISHEKARP